MIHIHFLDKTAYPIFITHTCSEVSCNAKNGIKKKSEKNGNRHTNAYPVSVPSWVKIELSIQQLNKILK